MYNQQSDSRPPFQFGGSATNPPPPDIIALLVVLFVTFSLQFFQGTAGIVGLMRLTSEAWRSAQVWKVATYPFAGFGPPSIWFLLELLILFWFSRDVHRYLGQKRFWQLLGWACVPAGLLAVGIDVLTSMGTGDSMATFQLMQGQRMLLTVIIAAFATLYGNATIMLFFVLPLKAKWFIALEILFAFMGFLSSHDLAGFLGICLAVGLTYSMLTGGGLRLGLRTLWLRAQHKIYEMRLRRHRARSGLRGIDGGKQKGGGEGGKGHGKGNDKGNGDVRRGPWVN